VHHGLQKDRGPAHRSVVIPALRLQTEAHLATLPLRKIEMATQTKFSHSTRQRGYYVFRRNKIYSVCCVPSYFIVSFVSSKFNFH
jgi:hypothetical protein